MLDQLKQHFLDNGQITLREAIVWTPEFKDDVQIEKLMQHRYTAHAPISITDTTFLGFLQELTGKSITISDLSVSTFKHKDFLLRTPCKEGILCIIDLGDEFPEGVGGDMCFATEEDTAIIPSTPNTLSLIHVDKNTEQFLTYITHHANDLKRKVIQFYI